MSLLYFEYFIHTRYLKLNPYFRVTCGECVAATDNSNWMSFADTSKARVTSSILQNSVAIRNFANVSDCM